MPYSLLIREQAVASKPASVLQNIYFEFMDDLLRDIQTYVSLQDYEVSSLAQKLYALKSNESLHLGFSKEYVFANVWIRKH